MNRTARKRRVALTDAQQLTIAFEFATKRAYAILFAERLFEGCDAVGADGSADADWVRRNVLEAEAIVRAMAADYADRMMAERLDYERRSRAAAKSDAQAAAANHHLPDAAVAEAAATRAQRRMQRISRNLEELRQSRSEPDPASGDSKSPEPQI